MRATSTVLLFAALTAAPSLRAAESCTGAPTAGQIELPGQPFKIAVSSDGCWIYASLTGQHGGLAILKRSPGGSVKLASFLKTAAPITGLVLSHDGSLLIATYIRGVMLIDLAKARAGDTKHAVVQAIQDDAPTASIYANLTADDKTLFVSNELTHNITVIDLGSREIVGRIASGDTPIALVFSPDEHWLYSTSQQAAADWGWPAVCDSEGAMAKHPKGAVLVINVAVARKDPAHAVAARIEAGCDPVRLALSPLGDRAYVTARKDNAVLVFDTAGRVKAGEIPVGSAPTPIAVINGGKTILVGDSRPAAGKQDAISVIDAATSRVTGNVRAGAPVSDIVASPDGLTIYVAGFASKTIDILDAAHLPLTPAGK